MKLTLQGIQDAAYRQKGYTLPRYNPEELAQRTAQHPVWLHFGAGNIFRVFPAALQSSLIDQGLAQQGIIVVETFDEQLITEVLQPHDNLALGVSLKQTGEMEKRVIASVTESIAYSTGYERCKAIFEAPSLQMVSMTITEKGYAVADSEGNPLPHIQQELENFAGRLSSVPAILTRHLYHRYLAGKAKLALVSLDNCSHNGTMLAEAVNFFARHWVQAGHMEQGFLGYLNDAASLAFNWTMIDKITPRPSELVAEKLAADGFEACDIVVTQKNTYAAAFVNAEECQYLAIEDNFPNGRPPLEKAGALFTDRTTIDKIEKMKVGTCLNPLHTVLAVFGCLLGYTSIAEEMRQPLLRNFITRLGKEEGMPVAVNPGIINAEQFMQEVIERRFPNPFVPDTPQRIACDTSKKIPIRFGETLKAYIARGQEDLSFLSLIPLFFAGWARYLLAVDDNGQPFTPSPDPGLESAAACLAGIALGDTAADLTGLRCLLADSSIFGVDLYKHGLGPKVEAYFQELIAGPGAITKTLERVVQA